MDSLRAEAVRLHERALAWQELPVRQEREAGREERARLAEERAAAAAQRAIRLMLGPPPAPLEAAPSSELAIPRLLQR
jgi:hypothetical protein